MDGEHAQRGRDQRTERERIRREPAAAQRSDEARPAREADRVDEHRKAENPDRFGNGELRVDGAERDSCEEHRGDSE